MNAESILRTSWKLGVSHLRYLALVVATQLILMCVVSGLAYAVAKWFVIDILPLFQLVHERQVAGFIQQLLGVVVVAIVGPSLLGVSTVAARQLLKQERPDILAAYREVTRRYPSFFSVSLVTLVTVGIGFQLLVLPGFIAQGLLFCAVAAVAYGDSGWNAMRASIRIARYHAGTLILVLLGLYLASFAIDLPVLVSRSLVGQAIWLSVFGIASALVTITFAQLVATVFYAAVKAEQH